MLLNRIKGIFIDLDGTLVDSLPVYVETYIDIFNELGIKVEEDFYKNKGETPQELARSIYEKYIKPLGISYEEFYKKRDELLEKKIEKINFTKGAEKFLSFLRERKYITGIVTSSSRDFTKKILENLGLDKFFDIIVTADDVKNTKPHPEPYLLAIQKSKLLPDECIAIEDSIYGILSAKSAGLNVIAVLTGSAAKQEIKNLGVYKIFKNLKEVLDFFNENLKEES